MKYIGLIGLFLFSQLVFGQIEDEDDMNFQSEISDNQIDSVDWNYDETIQLDDTKAYALNLKTDDEKKYYLWLEKRVDDVYPFVQKAVYEYYFVKDSARKIQDKRQRKNYINKHYQALADEYESKLKNMTTSRGQIMTRLIEKETSITTYDMIKELRGGMNAFLWNAAGGAFSINLKDRFDPQKTREDRFIQVILQRGITSGKYPEILDREIRKDRINPILQAFGRE